MLIVSAIRFMFCISATAAAPPATMPFDRTAWEMEGPVVLPWKTITPEQPYCGQWLVAGDLDSDGQAELVIARQSDQAITTVLVYKLDGSVLWRWGKAGAGEAGLHSDEPLQIYDLDSDGRQEVWLSIENYLLVLDGRDGKEQKRFRLPEGLKVADCITFANLRGLPRATDIIVKDRYKRVWAYTGDWTPLWDWAPAKYKTAHHPTLMDIDGDGRDEVMAGYSLLDHDGKELWTLRSEKVDLARGHLDCCEVLRTGKTPEDARLVVTCCGAKNIMMVDGRGKTIWELPGQHFESVDIGRLRGDVTGRQIAVDVAHEQYREATLWLLDEEGNRLGMWRCGESRHHRLIDWNGDGLEELAIGEAMRLFNGQGECVARFGPWDGFGGVRGRSDSKVDAEPMVLIGDLDGDERPEIILYAMRQLRIYRNEAAAKVPALKLGTGTNLTLY